MNLFTSTRSPILSVGIMLPEGSQKASITKGLTKPKTRAKDTSSMTRYSSAPPPFLVAGRPDETREHYDGEARRDGLLGRKPHSKHHQRDHHHPATDTDES